MSAQIRPDYQPSVRLFDKRTVGRETKRWLWWAMDAIAPRRKNELKGWYLHGGEEVGTLCLRKFGIGFIPRGLPALLESAPDFMPEEHLRNVGGGTQQGLIVDNAAGDAEEVQSRLPYVLVYPGDARSSVLIRADNHMAGRKGIVELPSLIGREWEECHNEDGTGILDIVERAFYGDGIEPTLKGLRNQITFGEVKSTLPIDLSKLKDEMLQSCEVSRGWGLAVLSLEHANLKQGTHAGGHVFEYSPLGRLMLEQLEVQPQDQPFAELARMTGSIAESVNTAMGQNQSSGMSTTEAVELGRKLAMAEMALAAKDEQIRQLTAEQVVKPTVLHTCDCGKSFDTPQGLALHKTRHCELNKE